MKPRKEEREWPGECVEEAASATECTGLVPALEDREAEANRRALYSVQRTSRPDRVPDERKP